MKQLYFFHIKISLAFIILVSVLAGNVKAQSFDIPIDTNYKPPIRIIADPSSYGPYFLNTSHTNSYFVTELPAQTSKVIMKYVDSKGEQLGDAFTETGTDLQTAVWNNEAEDIGFVLSPQMILEIHYSSDSIAIYNFAYTVYPDTVKINASAGWGPFFSNNYQLANGWEPVAETLNTFSAGNLPPRTDTVEFRILDIDSTIIKSHMVIAAEGEYLDTAVFANVRMDSLPLKTMTLRTMIFCEGGPKQGLSIYKELDMLPQQARLVSIVDNKTLEDSIDVFTEHEFTGQALQVDKEKHASISNGPGIRDKDKWNQTIYRGPYCLDLFTEDYSIEAWFRFDLEKIQNTDYEGMMLMSVDSIWGLHFSSKGDAVTFTMMSLVILDFNEIFTAEIPFEELATSEWHHFAMTSKAAGANASEMNIYLNGKLCQNTTFDADTYWSIRNNVPYKFYMKTQPLYLGTSPALDIFTDDSYITAMDEVRVWNCALSSADVKQNYHRKVLQSDSLVGYWNFDDLRNRLGYISDISYKNNRGHLKNGATFIPQHPQIQSTPDSILFYSSNALTDSVIYSFVDQNEQIVSGDTTTMENAGDTLLFDLSTLPDNMAKLSIREFASNYPDTGFIHTYFLHGLAPIPIATPRYNWNSFYTADDFGVLNNSVVVSGLPNHTTKVILGLQKGEETYNVDTLSQNSIPYRHSLQLNGTNNYIQTIQNVNSTLELTMSFWFKTTTTQGGKIIGFTDTQNGITSGKHDREVIMKKDGSLRFYLAGEDSTYILSAVNKYNDGMWHNVKIRFKEFTGAELHVDGCLVDYSPFDDYLDPYSGYWVMGRNHESKQVGNRDWISEYFEGSICEVMIADSYENDLENMAATYSLVGKITPTYYYKFDEGTGNTVNDAAGNNTGTLMGSTQNWFSANTISFVAWDHNILNKAPGNYGFFARIFYLGGPEEGVMYLLGNNNYQDPFPAHNFTYNLRNGFGYFNEGTLLTNNLDFWINNTDSDSANWKENFLRYKFYQPNHNLISTSTFTYTVESTDNTFGIDMGDAFSGSYLSLEVGYHTTDDKTIVTDQIAFPLYFNPMLAPIVVLNPGPFDQNIAPGSMLQPRTSIITTEIMSDLNKVKAKFYDKNDRFLGETDAVQFDDTTWHINYNMGTLHPPTSKLKIEYFLGNDTIPALVQGPFAITIHKTRPRWFDFLDNSAFHDVAETDKKVTFKIHTPLTRKQNGVFNPDKVEKVILPASVQLIGSLVNGFYPAVAEAKLVWDKPAHKLELNGDPLMSQKIMNLSGGNTSYVGFSFNHSQYDTCRLDEKNDLIVTQNFTTNGSIAKSAPNIIDLTKKIKWLGRLTKALDPIVGPDFSIVFTGEFDYASRLNMMTDTVNGGWGSVGNLDVDANPDHGDAYLNSASYQFYATGLTLEVEIGAKLLTGLIKGDFGLDGRLVMGWGHSYVDLPTYKEKHLKSGEFQIYGRFFIAILWGWYSENVWGPQLFYHHKFWDKDMTNCFPSFRKDNTKTQLIEPNASMPDLVRNITPVRKFTKMPMPVPEPLIYTSAEEKVFTWIERGDSYGERKLSTRNFNTQSNTFSTKHSIEINNHALNNHFAEAIDNELSFVAWAQTRHDNQSILKVKPTDVLKEFVQSQDIHFAIYDHKNDSVILRDVIDDDFRSINRGRAEANPVLAVLSESRVAIVWQVADIVSNEAEIWYAMLEKTGDNWTAGSPQLLTRAAEIATNLEIASTNGETAVITWLNSNTSDTGQNKIMTAIFDGVEWTVPHTLLNVEDHYYNYQSLKIKHGYGGLLVNTFVEDSVRNYEKIQLLKWDNWNNEWDVGDPIDLVVDSIRHIQLPRMSIQENGKTVIAYKTEEFIPKTGLQRISQADLLVGDLSNMETIWKHIEANEYVCDTTKQLADFKLSWMSDDTIMMLSNEYPVMPTNTMFEPLNGVVFGDPYMNLVLRCFSIDEDGEIKDVNEQDFFTDMYEKPAVNQQARLYQNAPNPCNETTTIIFDLADSDHVLLELYDITGTRIAIVLDQHLPAGRYNIELNTSLLQNGTYIYRLSSGKYSSSLKMIVGR